MKKLPIGIQTFCEIISENYLYIDKTEYICRLMQGKYYFLSRPRRFGKSLLITTIKDIFSGNQELFKNLWIYDKIDWQRHPVIHIDFSIITHGEGRETFINSLNYFLDKIAGDYGLSLAAIGNKEKFYELAEKLNDKYGKVVILIDEYDKPIIDYIENTQKAGENKEVLASFYEVIKNIDKYIKFVLITGVSKFSKVSIFSKLNNLDDITMRKEYNCLCGYTQSELETYFAEHLEQLLETYKMSKSCFLKKIKKWYNGYSWYDGSQTVYNPFGILQFFNTKEFKNYWFQTATPTFLLKLLKEQKVEVKNYENYIAGEALFETFDLENLHPASLLFQTGYLTIKKQFRRRYTLSYPNFEVKESFLVHLLALFSGTPAPDVEPLYLDMQDFLREEKIERFERTLKAVFAGIPSFLHLAYEAYYQSLFYLVLALVGAEIILEENTDKGRIDGVLEFEDLVYIIEFKMETAAEALEQIKDRRYYEKYTGEQRKVILLGIGGFRQKAIEVVSEVWSK